MHNTNEIVEIVEIVENIIDVVLRDQIHPPWQIYCLATWLPYFHDNKHENNLFSADTYCNEVT